MKKLLLTAALAFTLLFTLNAQTKKKQVFLHDTAVMTELGLTAEQQAKILEIKTLTDPQISEVRTNTALSPEEAKERLKKVYADRTEMQNKVLTGKQLQKLKEMRDAAKRENAQNNN